jgi:hypothetical protein
MSEQYGTHRPRKKRDRKGREGLQDGRRRIRIRKEQLRENENRGRCVDIEIEKLDRGPGKARK